MIQIADVTSQLADVHRDLSRVSVRWDPLGYDRNGSCYWWHAQDGRLFVEQRVKGGGGGRGESGGDGKAAAGASSAGAVAASVTPSSPAIAVQRSRDSVPAAAPAGLPAAEGGKGGNALQLVEAEDGESAVWGYYEAVEEVRIEQCQPTRMHRCLMITR